MSGIDVHAIHNGYLYVRFGSNWILRGLFYGIGPLVVALIFKSCFDLGKKTLRVEKLAWSFAIAACIITLIVQKELTLIFLVAGALGIFVFYDRARSAGPAGSRQLENFPLFLSDRVSRIWKRSCDRALPQGICGRPIPLAR